jgi:hypothetical protein
MFALLVVLHGAILQQLELLLILALSEQMNGWGGPQQLDDAAGVYGIVLRLYFSTVSLVAAGLFCVKRKLGRASFFFVAEEKNIALFLF